jgi:hypothetical protein
MPESIPIDMVFTYVDGGDPEHRIKRDLYADRHSAEELNFDREPGKSIDMLYTNVGEITYSVRSVLKYLPWIRTVYIVTDQQTPPVDQHFIDSGRVRIVDHTDLIPSEYLPTFNSVAIESCLHRIEGLSEIFLYNNDDCLHFSPVTQSMLYSIDGTGTISLMLYSYWASVHHLQHIISDLLPKSWFNINAHAMSISNASAQLIRHYQDLKWLDIIVPVHMTFIIRKRTAFRLENELSDALHTCRLHRFRTRGMLSYATMLYTVEKKWHTTSSGLKLYGGGVKKLHHAFNFVRSHSVLESRAVWQKVVCSSAPFVCLNNMKSFEYGTFISVMREKGLGEPIVHQI